MPLQIAPLEIHSAGEVVGERRAAARAVLAGPLPVATHGRRFHVEWEADAPVTPRGQLVFFSQFLATAGLFRDWGQSCPLRFQSNNAPELNNLPGTLTRVIESGRRVTLRLTSTHAEAARAQALLTNLSLFLSGLKNAAEQLTPAQCWERIWARILSPMLTPIAALPGPGG